MPVPGARGLPEPKAAAPAHPASAAGAAARDTAPPQGRRDGEAKSDGAGGPKTRSRVRQFDHYGIAESTMLVFAARAARWQPKRRLSSSLVAAPMADT